MSLVDPLAVLRGKATATVPEVARVMGISRATAYEAVRRSEIPSLRLGKRIVIPVPRLLQMLEGGNSDE